MWKRQTHGPCVPASLQAPVRLLCVVLLSATSPFTRKRMKSTATSGCVPPQINVWAQSCLMYAMHQHMNRPFAPFSASVRLWLCVPAHQQQRATSTSAPMSQPRKRNNSSGCCQWFARQCWHDAQCALCSLGARLPALHTRWKLLHASATKAAFLSACCKLRMSRSPQNWKQCLLQKHTQRAVLQQKCNKQRKTRCAQQEPSKINNSGC